MQNNNSKLNTILLVILIILVGFVIWFVLNKKDSNLESPIVPNQTSIIEQENPVVTFEQTTEANYEEQIKWATANNGLPMGWVKWFETIAGVSVEKFGPSISEFDYIVKLPSQLLSRLPQEKKCVGDSEVAKCAIGRDEEVMHYFDVTTYRD